MSIFFHVRGDGMPVSVLKLQQLMSRIDTDDLVEVEKVERYISLVKGAPENVVEYREKEEPAGEDLVKFG
ncbi:hypothetical protein AF332_20230 [Sporosarcina globispora]|uniref:Uncharacterized protein n=1 Tax=Sporosarcina globispora TaxID=1459 RepID=A0A0M0GHI2_SPOGL|nr:hypothetical protein AF332_20230 [Sporosarcina globispora]